MSLETIYSRRNALEAGVALIGLSILGCNTPAAPAKPTVRPPEPTTGIPEGLPRLSGLVNVVTNPFVRQYLQTEILPIYQATQPMTKEYGGEIFNVAPGKIILGSDPKEIKGEFSPRETTPDSSYHFVVDYMIRYPLVGILRPDERDSYDIINGIPYITFAADPSTQFITDLRPYLRYLSPPTNLFTGSNRDNYEKMKSFVYLKEVCTHLLYNSYIINTVETMKRLGFPTKFKVVDAKNTISDVNCTFALMSQVNNRLGRTAALIDIGGSVLAIKALIGTGFTEGFITGSTVTKTMTDEVVRHDFGSNIRDVYPKIADYVLNDPDAEKYYHYANFQDIP